MSQSFQSYHFDPVSCSIDQTGLLARDDSFGEKMYVSKKSRKDRNFLHQHTKVDLNIDLLVYRMKQFLLCGFL